VASKNANLCIDLTILKYEYVMHLNQKRLIWLLCIYCSHCLPTYEMDFFLHLFPETFFLFHSCHGHLKDKVPSWNGVGSSSHHLTRSRLYMRSLISLWMQIFAWVYVPLLYLFQFWLLAIMRNLDKLWLCWILKWSTGKISCQGADLPELLTIMKLLIKLICLNCSQSWNYLTALVFS